MNSNLTIEPDVEAKRIYASKSVEEARILAEQEDIEGSTAAWQQALARGITRPLTASQPVTGTISPRVSDFWTFEGKAGQAVTVDMVSDDSDLDTYLTILGPDLRLLDDDDNSGVTTNSRIHAPLLPSDGVYLVVAGGFGGSEGAYRLVFSFE